MTQEELNNIVESVIDALTKNSVNVESATIVSELSGVKDVIAYSNAGEIVKVTPSTLVSGVASQLEEKTKMIVNLGTVSSSSVAENNAKSYAENPNIVMIVYTTEDGQQGYIRQSHSRFGNTLQFLNLDGNEYVRTVNYNSGMSSRWYDISGNSLIHQLRYDAGSCKISFWNPIHDETFGGVAIPVATTTASGLLSAEDKNKIDNASVVQKVTWDDTLKLYSYTETGVYEITGNKVSTDDLPSNIPTGTQFTARLSVLYVNISGSTSSNAKTVVQILEIADSTNRYSGTFIRQAQSSMIQMIAGGGGWTAWKQLVYKGEQSGVNETSNDVIADVNISTKSNNVQITTKSWGGNSFVTRATILAAASNRAGVMTAQMYQDFINLKTQVANLQNELNALKGQ